MEATFHFLLNHKVKRIVFTLVLLIMFSYVNAQDAPTTSGTSGIFVTERDFLENKISMFTQTDSRNSLEQQLSDIIIVRNGAKYKFKYGSVFGYYKDGFKFRSYSKPINLLASNGYFKVLSDSAIYIYSKMSVVPKTDGRLWYYYSETLDSPMKRLTIPNMRKDFAGKPEYITVAKSVIKFQPAGFVQRLH